MMRGQMVDVALSDHHVWSAYPIHRFEDVPDSVEAHILDRPGMPFLGSAECGQGSCLRGRDGPPVARHAVVAREDAGHPGRARSRLTLDSLSLQARDAASFNIVSRLGPVFASIIQDMELDRSEDLKSGLMRPGGPRKPPGVISLVLRVSTFGLAGVPMLACGQQGNDTPSPVVQEVTVTAERADTILRKTPVSVGVVGEGEIQSRGMTQLRDLVGVVAGVVVPNGDANQPQAVGIRGVGVSNPAMSQAVGIYIDDVPLVRGYATGRWDLPDIERIEVLRGPQGTLYGENTTAGAVKYVSIDPSRDAAAWASAALGDYGQREVRGYARGGLGDGPLSASLAFSRRTNDGFGYDATTGQRVNKLDATQFRAKLGLAADAKTSAVLSVDGLLDRSDTNTVDYPLNAPDAAPRVTFTPVDGAFKRKSGGIELKVEHPFAGDVRFRSISAIRSYRDDPTDADFGGLSIPSYDISQTVWQRVFSQEFQLQRRSQTIDWTAGAIVVADTFAFDRFTTVRPPAAPASSTSEALTHLHTTDIGLYGQMRYAIDDITNLTLALRDYRTHQTGSNASWASNDYERREAVIYSAPNLSAEHSGLLPKVVLDRQWTPDLFSYASIARGEKFGGFNRAAQSLRSAEVATKPERVTTYEFGTKGRFAGGALSASLAVFYNDYRDYIASLSNVTIDGVLVTDAVLVNAGRARTYGADADLAAKLGRDTDATLSLEWLRSSFSAFANPTGTAGSDYVGNQLPYAPPVSLGARLAHAMAFDDGSSLTLNASVQYLQRQHADVANAPGQVTPTQTYVNLGAAWRSAERHWTFMFQAKNIFDKTYVLIRDQIPSLSVDAANYNPPRTVLFTARYDI